MISEGSWFSRFQVAPQRFEYRQALRILSGGREPVAVFQVQSQDIGYNHRCDISGFKEDDAGFHLIVNRCALIGTQGILPHYIRDAARYCSYDLDESALEDFFQIFNEAYLWLDYRSDVAGYLPLYIEQAWLKRVTPPNNFANFTGIFSQHQLGMLPYALWGQIHARSLSGLGDLFEYCVGHKVSVESKGLSRWHVGSHRRWHLQSGFLLGRNTLVGSFAWAESEVVRITIHLETERQWSELRHNSAVRVALETLARALLPYRFINYFVELPESLTEHPVLSSRQKSYRLSYYNGEDVSVATGYVRVALPVFQDDTLGRVERC